MVGTHQIVAHRCERQHTNFEREVGHGHLARHMVSGVQECEAEEEGFGYDTRGEDVKGFRRLCSS